MTSRIAIRIALGTALFALLAGGYTAYRVWPADNARPPASIHGAMPAASAMANAGNMDVLAQRLATRLQSTDPGDGNGWALLARAYVMLGRNEEAVAAFERAHALLGDSDAQLQADEISARAALVSQRPSDRPVWLR